MLERAGRAREQGEDRIKHVGGDKGARPRQNHAALKVLLFQTADVQSRSLPFPGALCGFIEDLDSTDFAGLPRGVDDDCLVL